MATPSLAVRLHQCAAAVDDGAVPVPAALLVFQFLLRSFFSRPRTERKHGSMDGTYCKLMIMIFCVVIVYVFLFFLFVCHLAWLCKICRMFSVQRCFFFCFVFLLFFFLSIYCMMVPVDCL
jgi:hypothetical protein